MIEENYHMNNIYSFSISKGIDIFLPLIEIINEIKKLGYKIRPFKKSYIERVEKTVGILNGLHYKTHLDVGSGRGNFIYPYLENKNKEIQLDIVEQKEIYCEIFNNSLKYVNLKYKIFNKNFLDFKSDKKYDLITLLEVLEHISNWEDALTKAISLSNKYIIISVPSKEDNNPEHLHVLTPKKIKKYLDNSKIKCNFKINGVSNHWIYLITL